MKENVQKIASTLTKLSGDEVLAKDAVEFEGFKYRIGETSGANIDYMYDLKDLVNYSHIFIRSLIKDRPIEKVAISIPTEAYYSSKLKEDGGVVQKMKENLERNIPTLKSVRVLPQGTSAVSYLVSKELVDPKNGNILVVDGGFNTVNISVTDETGKILYTNSIHDELGVYNLLTDYFREELKRKHDEVTTNAQMLKEIFLKEKIDFGFNSVNITREKEQALSQFLPKLMERVTRELKKKKIDFDQFVFVGGISYYISKDAISSSKTFYLPEENGEFLTLLGMREIVGEDYDVFDVGFGDVKYDLQVKEIHKDEKS